MRRVLLMMGLFLLMVPAVGCAMGREVLSPTIEYTNLSSADINNIRGVWGGNRVVTTSLSPGGAGSMSFAMSSSADFYKEVHLTWENAAGKRFEKNFVITKEEFPPEDMKKKGLIDYVSFEFTQNGVSYYTHRTPGAEERGRKAFKVRDPLRRAYIKNKSN